MTAAFVVTGGAGFIGSHLSAALLARGDRVVVVDNFDPFYDRAAKEANLRRLGRCELVEADVRERAVMADLLARDRPEAVFHFAALAGVRPSVRDPARFASVNVDGLISVLDAARGAGCRRVVFSSSSSVYGNNRKAPFAEDDRCDQPISPYAATKCAGELICCAYAHLFGLSIGCLRLFTVYGPAQRPDLAISLFMRLIAARRPVPMFGDGSSSRDYTYVDDIVAGCLAAQRRLGAMEPGAFRIWNLGGSRPVALRELIERIAALAGCAVSIDRQPAQPGDVERTWADLARSRAELEYVPKVSLDEGLRRQWQWMQDQRALRA